jgi:leucyl/phenylalanyl-tRNA--protein transferase
LAGGVYGLAIGGFFSAESMYHRVADASKVALASLVARLRTQGFLLIDVQMVTEHTRRVGAVELSRRKYLCRLQEAIAVHATFGDGSAAN